MSAPIHNEFRLVTISFIRNPRNAGTRKIETEQKKIAEIRRKIKEDSTLEQVELVFIRYWIWLFKDIVLNQLTSSV